MTGGRNWREEQMPELNGGCLCGAVRYTSNSAPEFIGVCHCRDCQKYTGSAFGIMVGLPKTALQIRGVVKTFSKLADSGKPILRHFCPECGSSIAVEPSRRPGTIILNAGTLDDAHCRDLLRPRSALGPTGRWYATFCANAAHSGITTVEAPPVGPLSGYQ